jgi:hypothetical protein
MLQEVPPCQTATHDAQGAQKPLESARMARTTEKNQGRPTARRHERNGMSDVTAIVHPVSFEAVEYRAAIFGTVQKAWHHNDVSKHYSYIVIADAIGLDTKNIHRSVSRAGFDRPMSEYAFWALYSEMWRAIELKST